MSKEINTDDYQLTKQICIVCSKTYWFKYTKNWWETHWLCSDECYKLHFKEKVWNER